MVELVEIVGGLVIVALIVRGAVALTHSLVAPDLGTGSCAIRIR